MHPGFYIRCISEEGKFHMKKTLMLATSFVLGLGIGGANAVTKTATWTWPTTRSDGTAMPLTQIGSLQLCDMSVPLPGGNCNGGTAVACPTTVPPTTATGTCTANVTPGHSFVLVVGDTATPTDFSAPSNTVIVPLNAPAAITDFKLQ
jgi:hypothetical protein